MPRLNTARRGAAGVVSAAVRYPGYTSVRSACLLRPPPAVALPAVVILCHGGDFCTGGIAAALPVASALTCALNAVVMTPDYTLAGERPFPAAVEDAYAAAVWARVHAAQGRWNADCMVVIGEEAGGNLAAAVALMARDRGGPALRAQVLISPMLDPTLTSGSMRDADGAAAHSIDCCAAAYRRYLPAVADHLHPYAAPAHCSRLSGVAPALIVTAASDPLRDEAQAYATALAAAGVHAISTRVTRVNNSDCGWTAPVMAAIRTFLLSRIHCSRHTHNHR